MGESSSAPTTALDETPPENENEEILKNGYTILRKIGHGAYAKIYLVQPNNSISPNTSNSSQEQDDPVVCRIVDKKDAPKHFAERELSILTRLNHPYIISIYSIRQREGKYYMFMRHAEKGDLFNFVMESGCVKESQGRVWARQLATGLQYLHTLAIAHRDIKCDNILITSKNNIKLTDFGFSRYCIDKSGHDVMSKTYCGTMMYCAPEILSGRPYNPDVVDYWSLGVVIYFMLNRMMPFHETNMKKLVALQTKKAWSFPEHARGILSNQVKELITKLLEPDVRSRWRAEDVLSSDWVRMDPRMYSNTRAETMALEEARQLRQLLGGNIVDPLPELSSDELHKVQY